MSGLVRALSSSVGRKLVMGITGLLLSGFLVVHLAGNLFLYVGPEAYDGYTHALHQQEGLVKLGEAVLVVLFVVHIFLGVRLTIDNYAARKKRYELSRSKQDERMTYLFPDYWMFWSGAVVLGFLILHLWDFTWELRPDIVYEGREPYQKAVAILRNPLSCAVYIVGSVILGVHLGHGFSSAFQSLGINHPRFNGIIKWLGIAFAWVIGIGFVSFPVWALLTSGDSVAH